jgi:hypothetical protein
VLREASLVSVRAVGTRRIYALDHAGLDAAQAWLARLADPLGPFTQPLDALATELARGRRARRAADAGQLPVSREPVSREPVSREPVSMKPVSMEPAPRVADEGSQLA